MPATVLRLCGYRHWCCFSGARSDLYDARDRKATVCLGTVLSSPYTLSLACVRECVRVCVCGGGVLLTSTLLTTPPHSKATIQHIQRLQSSAVNASSTVVTVASFNIRIDAEEKDPNNHYTKRVGRLAGEGTQALRVFDTRLRNIITKSRLLPRQLTYFTPPLLY